MEPLVVAACHLFGHLLHVAPVTLEQAVEITFGRVFNRAGLALKAAQVGPEMVVKMGKRRLD